MSKLDVEIKGVGCLINLSHAARVLGVSRQTVYDMLKRGELTVVRMVGLPYVRRQDVDELLRRRSGVSD